MAAFIFPNNPANDQVVTNSETGTRYIYQAVPGKWVVYAKNPENSFVELAGDTMTGELRLANTDLSILKANGNVHSQFGPVTSLIGSTLEVRGNIVTASNVTCKNVSSSGIVNAFGELRVTGVSTFNNSADLTGNLTINQSSTDDQTGRLYLKHSDGTTNIALYGAGGGIDMKGSLSFNSTNVNKNIRAYGNSSPKIRFLTGAEASSVAERLSITSTAVTVNTNLIGNFGVVGQNIDATGTLTAGQNLFVGTTSTLTGNVTTGADLTVGGDLTVTGTFNTSGTTDRFDSQITIEAPDANFKPGLSIKTTNNSSTLWNRTQPGTIQFETTSGSNGGTCGIFVNGDSPTPSFVMAIGAPGYSLDRVFTYSYSGTYGKRIYMYPNWGSQYSNASNLPDATPVTLGYMRNQGLLTQALTSVLPSNDPNDLDDAITTQTSVSVGAQMQLDGRLTAGRGFSLSGCTTDQPTNTSAICVQLYHPITAAAQLLYRGDTTGDNDCVQTKASTLTLVRGAANTFTAANKFHNTVNIGTSSAGHLVDVFNVLRVRANTNNSLGGLNNGAIYVNDKTGVTVAGLYDEGLYSTKKLIFNSNAGSQDIYLQGADRKGLNIKYNDGSSKQVLLATFDPDGSVLKSTLDMQSNKITNLSAATDNNDATNKLYVDTAISNAAITGNQTFENLTLTGTGALTIHNAGHNAGINFTATSSVQLIKAYGASNKALKYMVGPTENDATQQLSIEKGQLTIGTGSHDQEITWLSSQQFQYFNMSSGSAFVFKFGATSGFSISNDTINNCPRIFLNSGAQIYNLGTPTEGTSAANKDYVDGLKTSIYSAVNGAADFAALKAALIAALA